MKFLVSSHPRAGTTLLANIASALSGCSVETWEAEIPFVLQESEKTKLKAKSDCVVKTGSLTRQQASALVGEFKLLMCVRPFEDVLIAELLFQKDRPAKTPTVQQMFDQYGDLPDVLFVNQWVENNFNEVRSLASAWFKNGRIMLGDNICGFTYKSLAGRSIEVVVAKIIKDLRLEVSAEQYNNALKATGLNEEPILRFGYGNTLLSDMNKIRIKNFLKELER